MLLLCRLKYILRAYFKTSLCFSGDLGIVNSSPCNPSTTRQTFQATNFEDRQYINSSSRLRENSESFYETFDNEQNETLNIRKADQTIYQNVLQSDNPAQSVDAQLSSESVNAKLSESVDSNLSQSVDAKSSQSIETTLSKSVDAQSSESVDAKSSESVQTKPSESPATKPSESVQTKPC